MRGRLGRELESSHYTHKGRPKTVRYWLMDIEHEDEFVPNDETDELRWVTPQEALGLHSYDRDRVLIESL